MGKYYANFNANNGTCLIHAEEFSSKEKAITTIRQWAVGETFFGNSFRWCVWDEDGRSIAEGYGSVYRKGTVSYYRVL